MNTWNELFKIIKDKPYYIKLEKFLDNEYSLYTIYPKRDDIFNAFKFTDINNIKVVIIGQDPYHNKNEANGLAFSVNKNIKIPPSLNNIFKEIEIEYNSNIYDKYNGDLTYLAKQGVLLINPILTVRENKPLSHDNDIYKNLFIDILYYLNNINKPLVFMLWGNKAKKYKKYLSNKNHFIIETCHPSPLSAYKGHWFNSNMFRKCNEFLKINNLEEIDWLNNKI